MAIRDLVSADRPMLRRATLANMNWLGPRFTFEQLDALDDITHYFSAFPRPGDFGLVDEQYGSDGHITVRAVAWVVFLTADDPGYGFVDERTPELSVTTFDGHRGQGVGTRLVQKVIAGARERDIAAISLSVEDGNGARRLYDRLGFQVVGRSGNSDTMLLQLE